MLLLSFISCETKEERPLSPEFEEVSALIQTDPETALSKLQNLSNSANQELSSLEYSILLAEALYKNYLPQSNFDDIKAIVDYIETEKTTPNYLRAKAHYYHAVGLAERDDIAGTCEHYLKALEIMEEELDIIEKRSRHFCELSHSDYEKIRFISLTYTRLGNLFYNESYCDLSMHKYKKALKYSELIKDTFAQSHIFKLLGNTYHILGKNDSALYYYNESIKTDFNPINRLDVEKSIALILFDKGEKDSAFALIKNNLCKIENYSSKNSYYGVLGEMYYKDKVYDSAIFYLEKSIVSQDYYTKYLSSVKLSAIYDSLGMNDKEAYYNDIVSVKNPMSEEDKRMAIVSKAKFIYDKSLEFKDRMIKEDLYDLYMSVEHPLIEVLSDMETNGIKVLPQVISELNADIKNRISLIEKKIYELAGCEFNVSSPKQLAEILNVSASTVSSYCTGRTEPSFDALLIICQTFNCF